MFIMKMGRPQFPGGFMPRLFLAPDDPQQSGGQQGGQQQRQPDPDDDPADRTFSLDYVRELRRENRSWRQKVTEAEARAADAAAKAEQAGKTAEDRIAQAGEASGKRIILSELKALALAAGMVDLDGLKLADLSTVSLDDKGEVKGGAELIEGLKKAKPYLFGSGNTGHTGKPPPAADQKAKSVKDMTDEEYRAAKKAAGLKK